MIGDTPGGRFGTVFLYDYGMQNEVYKPVLYAALVTVAAGAVLWTVLHWSEITFAASEWRLFLFVWWGGVSVCSLATFFDEWERPKTEREETTTPRKGIRSIVNDVRADPSLVWPLIFTGLFIVFITLALLPMFLARFLGSRVRIIFGQRKGPIWLRWSNRSGRE